MFEFLAVAMLIENAPRGLIDFFGMLSRMDHIKGGQSGFHDGLTHENMLLCRFACGPGPGDIGPVAIAASIGVDHHQIIGIHFPLACTRICCGGGRGVGTGHAVKETVTSLHACSYRRPFKRRLVRSSDICLSKTLLNRIRCCTESSFGRLRVGLHALQLNGCLACLELF